MKKLRVELNVKLVMEGEEQKQKGTIASSSINKDSNNSNHSITLYIVNRSIQSIYIYISKQFQIYFQIIYEAVN